MKLKKWVEIVLMAIMMISFMFMGAECKDTKTFIIGHLINASIFILTSTILAKYGRIN